MTAFLGWLLQCSIVVALIIPIVAAACWLFRWRPAIQHAVWAVILLKFLTPTIVTWPWPMIDVLDSASVLVPNWSNDAAIHRDAGKGRLRDGEQTFSVLDEFAWIHSGEASRIANFFSTLSFFVWGFGATIYASRQFLRIRKQKLMVKNAVTPSPAMSTVVQEVAKRFGLHPPKTLIVSGIESPAVWCLGQPALLWPQSMASDSAESIPRSIVAHELAHIRRHDHWMTWLQLIASVIWWWNPLFWLVRRKLNETAEMACDAVALDAFPTDRCFYAESLLSFVATPKTGLLALGLGVRPSAVKSLERRMHLIVSGPFDGKLPIGGVLLAALIAVVVAPNWSLGTSQDVTQVQSNAGSNSVSPELDARYLNIRDGLRRRAQERLNGASRDLARTTAAHSLASNRVDALKRRNEDESGRTELDEAERLLELATSELEFAEAFHDLAERQMKDTK